MLTDGCTMQRGKETHIRDGSKGSYEAKAVLRADDDVTGVGLRMNSMMAEDLAHAIVHLEEDREELRIFDGHLEAVEGIAGAIHASEEVEDEMLDG